MKITRIYRGEDIHSPLLFEHNKSYNKRPSWIRINNCDEDLQFIKIMINEEAFWYRRYFQNYFFPLNNTSEDYKEYYNEIASSYENLVPQNVEIANFIVQQLEKEQIPVHATIFEIGAGTGLVSEVVAKKGYPNLTLLDISNKSLEIAQKKMALKNCTYIVGDIKKYHSPYKFDVILNSMSLDYFHEEELDSIIKNIKTMLKPQGLFISVDRHIYPQYSKYFKNGKESYFNLSTPEGTWRYDYFISKNE